MGDAGVLLDLADSQFSDTQEVSSSKSASYTAVEIHGKKYVRGSKSHLVLIKHQVYKFDYLLQSILHLTPFKSTLS